MILGRHQATFQHLFKLKPFSNLEIEIILTNTYHLAHQPGTDVLDHFGGVHNFMKWEKPILTDSGGFQMVSLVHLSTVKCSKIFHRIIVTAPGSLLQPFIPHFISFIIIDTRMQ